MRSERSTEILLLLLFGLLLAMIIADLLFPFIHKHSKVGTDIRPERNAASFVCRKSDRNAASPSQGNSI